MNSGLSKLYYFSQKAFQDYSNPLIYQIHDNNCTPALEEYYFIFNRRELLNGGSYNFAFDENDIPMIKGHVADTDGSFFYYPTAIGQFALAVFHDYLKHRKRDDKKLFLKLAEWFVDNASEQPGSDVIYWPDNQRTKLNVYDESKIQKLSSMGQSRTISVLLRAFQLTEERKYRDRADQAVLAYQTPPEKGGFMFKENDLILFEEPNRAKVLNHLIFSIFGLHDYCRDLGFNTDLNALLKRSIASIKKIIPNYDCGWWSLYDDYYEEGQRRFNPCTRHYHHIHIQQLSVLSTITGDSYFKETANKWRAYDKSAARRFRMLFHKSITVKKMKRL